MTANRNIPDTSPIGDGYKIRYLVLNGTNGPITNLRCLHGCCDILWNSDVLLEDMSQGATSAVQTFTSLALWPDVWLVAFRRQGQLYFNSRGIGGNVSQASTGGLCVIHVSDARFQVLPPCEAVDFFTFDLPFIPGTPTSPEDARQRNQEADGAKKADDATVGEEYPGLFVVINATNEPITDVMVKHECETKSATYQRAQL